MKTDYMMASLIVPLIFIVHVSSYSHAFHGLAVNSFATDTHSEA